jgi:hypothetical protein
LEEKTRMPCRSIRPRSLKAGSPIFTPSAFTSSERAMAQPSLLLSTSTGTPASLGSKARSQAT